MLCFISIFVSASESDEVQENDSGKTYASYTGVIYPYLQKYLYAYRKHFMLNSLCMPVNYP